MRVKIKGFGKYSETSSPEEVWLAREWNYCCKLNVELQLYIYLSGYVEITVSIVGIDGEELGQCTVEINAHSSFVGCIAATFISETESCANLHVCTYAGFNRVTRMAALWLTNRVV